MSGSDLLQIVTAGIGSVGFALIFELRGNKLVTIGCGGALTWFVFLAGSACASALWGLFAAVVFAAGLAEIEARRRKTPVLVMEVPLLIPLIPGGDLYRMMVSIMQKGIRESVEPIVWLVQEVFIIAAGVILASTVASAVMKVKQKILP